ncbi:MAG: division/cell wall cluster transcriptional repressor MraZ [Magnetococcales bacterium]|nr:division/cell wall cluster transcriptional repressor MraZ [Magnetococcales bacterium]
MFLGKHLHNLDDKGRVSIPAAFRKVMQQMGSDRLIITRGKSPCLVAFTVDEWSKVIEKTEKEPMLDDEVEAFERTYLAHASEIEVDRQGRVLIPEYLRELADLDKEAVFAGRNKKFEIWNPTQWAEAVRESGQRLNSAGGRLKAII